MALTSDELNYLVYKYLLESGFTHSAFAFGNESYVNQRTIAPERAIPPGALISFVQKGLQYLELEANLNEVRVCAMRVRAWRAMRARVALMRRDFAGARARSNDRGARIKLKRAFEANEHLMTDVVMFLNARVGWYGC